jgi:hypothetical protein
MISNEHLLVDSNPPLYGRVENLIRRVFGTACTSSYLETVDDFIELLELLDKKAVSFQLIADITNSDVATVKKQRNTIIRSLRLNAEEVGKILLVGDENFTKDSHHLLSYLQETLSDTLCNADEIDYLIKIISNGFIKANSVKKAVLTERKKNITRVELIFNDPAGHEDLNDLVSENPADYTEFYPFNKPYSPCCENVFPCHLDSITNQLIERASEELKNELQDYSSEASELIASVTGHLCDDQLTADGRLTDEICKTVLDFLENHYMHYNRRNVLS